MSSDTPGAAALRKGRPSELAGGGLSATDARHTRVALVASRFNSFVTEALVAGARACLAGQGVEQVEVSWTPGAFELPLAASRLASSGDYDAVVCLGAVIRGDTDHYEHVAAQTAAGIQRVQLDTGVPVLFGVLTTETVEQAVARAGPDEANKGREAALAALEMVALLRRLPCPGAGSDGPGESRPPARGGGGT
jgi:6,7-dimethyl-8-ribityllumazine synthase